MNMLAITPQEFQGAAIAWVGVITVILGAVLAAVPVVISKLAAAKEAYEQLGKRVDDHSKRITGNSERLTNVALHVTPSTEITNQNKA